MKKKKDGEWENIERREWRGLFRWPFVIFMSIIINVEIILILIHVSFLGYFYCSCGEKKKAQANLLDINAN